MRISLCAVVVVPGVVEKIDASVDSRANNANTLLLVFLHAEVVAAESDHRYLLACAAERSPGYAPGLGPSGRIVERSCKSSDGCGLQETSAVHKETPASDE